ncbi:peptidoglycan DD-metalloendopeptidase family protein [Bradyrhizobium canariense]|uniref:Murein DD-endopeptidase MepM and murein hydrolase activator NlpD, contain LysM domain n=1 Tax=Bradyrhizobium canariense TaxID=255045 RepID=A0A1H1PXS7_9BRAD|nr:peptidoglycan DD-metalloendopeptidase family protein [Bradyrhizobium canariense]SDS15933.1 Murein DD-endopeptidase MepM and murein hydrolase activator NlpD, contain LysM domain [Bradyrhizobium canariense]
MSRVVELLGSRRVPQVAALALMSIGFAGCSADMSTRLSQSSFSNPFASQEATGSVPVPAAERRELPQYSRPQYQSSALPPISAPQSYPASHSYSAAEGVSGGGRGIGSYSPPTHQPLESTGSVAPRSVAATHRPEQGGTKIIVGTSDTLEILSRRYNVSPAAIMQANGYKGPRALSPGQQLIIPRPMATAAAPALAAPVSRPVAVAAAVPNVHVVNHGDTLASIARRNHMSVAELARANHLDPSAKLGLGMKLTVPARSAALTPAAQPVAVAAAQPVAAAPVPAVTRVAAVAGDTQQKVRLAQSAPNSEEPAVESPVKAAEATGAVPTFRWPVRGKVITAYGAKANGKSNDGINLAVPEGTPIKAADDGVVAYSGNELKGYGNLVLIRHANGYVTAYAHASELLVKRGDTIKRGQVIAKSGQSGEVQSPQLHFEIRKGSSPVDPLQFLNGA